MSHQSIDDLKAYLVEIYTLNQIVNLLAYDQDVSLPPKGISLRSEQIALAVRLLHERKSSPTFKALIENARPAAVGSVERRLVEVAGREAHQATCMPADFVAQEAAANSLGNQAWGEAKANNDFGRFLPYLQKGIESARRRAAYLKYCENEYDSLLYSYNYGIGSDQLDPLFEKLTAFLTSFASLHKSTVKTDIFIPLNVQEKMAKAVASSIGMHPDWSVLAVARHPSSNMLGPGDIRITTRYDQDNGLASFFAVLHECGHALYDYGTQNSLKEPLLNQNASMGLHESQSLFLENHVGRSVPFLTHWYNRFKEAYPALDLTEREWLQRISAVKPSFYRVEADEVTYCLHVAIRYEIEKDMIVGGLQAKDVPHHWNQLYKKYLNISPENDKQGCLQDIHWSMGHFGYFPSYALGHVVAAQLRKKMEREIAPIDDCVKMNRIGDLMAWQKTHIHALGRLEDPLDIVRKVCDEDLSADAFCSYLQEKRNAINAALSIHP